MNLLFVVDPLPRLKAYKDTSIAMMREAKTRGHRVFTCDTDDLTARGRDVIARVCELALPLPPLPSSSSWYAVTEESQKPLTAFDAIIMRKDPPFNLEYVYTTYLLELAEEEGVVVVNKPQSLRDFNEKTAILRFPELTVPTMVTRRADILQNFIEEHQDVVLKPLNGMGGASIFRVRADEVNRNVIIETLNDFGRKSVMAQRYIPEVTEGDKRVLIIDGEVVPFSLARIPQKGELRGNLAAGGRGLAMPLTAREREIAERLSVLLNNAGLFLVGLDIIGGFLTEINVTSPTCFVEITEQSRYNVAQLFLSRLETLVTRKPRLDDTHKHR